MLRVIASTTFASLRPFAQREALLNPIPCLRSRSRPRPQPLRALSSSAPPDAALSAGAAECAVVLEEEHLRCAAAGRAPLRVAVLVSGGVHSSVALRRLHAVGHRCTAFYLKIWFQEDEDFRNFSSECPWDEDLKYAQAVCDKIDVPLEVVSDEESSGAFVEAIESLGFNYIASGHYAHVKDQTYFLSHLSQSQLRRLLFPLGCMTKDEVRKLAAQMGLPNQSRKDTQGISFLGKVNCHSM